MFTLIRLEKDMNIFFIVKKDILSESGDFLQLPFTVYGFLRVEGIRYTTANVSYRNIADDVTPEELKELARLARSIVCKKYWEKKNCGKIYLSQFFLYITGKIRLFENKLDYEEKILM